MAKVSPLDWRRAGVEMLGIIFAVLLALWLESWREDVEQAERTNDYLTRIRAEIVNNRADLINSIENTEGYIVGVQTVLKSGEIDIKKLAPFLQVSGAASSRAAWTSAQMTQSISRMSVTTVTELASVYDTQAYYQDYIQHLFRQFSELSVGVQDESKVLQTTRKFLIQQEIANSLARQLLEGYDAYLKLNADEKTAKVSG